MQNRVRLLVDVDYAPVPLVPRMSPLTGHEVDMSMCFLRSMSPIHLQYLRNMGVNATLVVSLVVGGKLWGLIACHHYAPLFVPFEVRSVSELLAELIATRIAALESFVQTQSELIVRRLEQRMIEAIGRDGDWRVALFDGSGTLLQSVNATGAALVYEGHVQTSGEVPATQQIRAIAAWLDGQPRKTLFSTATLGLDAPEFAPLTTVATGLLATPISASPGEYLLWFRPERKHTVTWGGDPNKPVIVGTDPRQLSPRLSFAQWHQVVEGTSDPWSRGDQTTAQLISGTIADMVLQFRSVRMLIAQDQLETLSRQVRQSDQPMIVAAITGRILLTNEAFLRLLQPGHRSLQLLEDLPQFFTDPLDMRRHIDELVRDDRSWRGEINLTFVGSQPKPLAIRAEPVYASLDRKLGYLLHFDEIADRKAAETARRDFHESMIDRRLLRTPRPRLDRRSRLSGRPRDDRRKRPARRARDHLRHRRRQHAQHAPRRCARRWRARRTCSSICFCMPAAWIWKGGTRIVAEIGSTGLDRGRDVPIVRGSFGAGRRHPRDTIRAPALANRPRRDAAVLGSAPRHRPAARWPPSPARFGPRTAAPATPHPGLPRPAARRADCRGAGRGGSLPVPVCNSAGARATNCRASRDRHGCGCNGTRCSRGRAPW